MYNNCDIRDSKSQLKLLAAAITPDYLSKSVNDIWNRFETASKDSLNRILFLIIGGLWKTRPKTNSPRKPTRPLRVWRV